MSRQSSRFSSTGRACILVILGLLGPALAGSTIRAQALPDQASASNPRVKVFELTSQAGNPYRIFLWEPDVPPPATGFPVIYLLDGNAYFMLAVEAYHRSSSTLPPAVIVGLGYPTDERFDRIRRTYDFTTPASPEKLPPTRIPGGWPKSGGADAFLGFLENELKPRIAEETAIDDNRQALVGHSFGGLLIMHTVFTRPQMFQSYVAISPSGWWNDYALLNEEQQFSIQSENLETPIRLMIAVGELELKGDVGPAAALEPTPAKEAFGSTRDFAQRLSKLQSEHLKVEYREFADQNHGSVVPIAMHAALPFILLTPAHGI